MGLERSLKIFEDVINVMAQLNNYGRHYSSWHKCQKV
jgi:hypothetical protein